VIAGIFRNLEDIWFEPKTTERLKRRLIGLVQYALASAWFDATLGRGAAINGGQTWFKVEIVRNQIVFGPGHSSYAIGILQKVHDSRNQEP
jgi:hypothetical protein